MVVSADSMRAIGYTRSNVRAGESAVGSLVVFSAVEVREANADERKELQTVRKAQKLVLKQRRAPQGRRAQARKSLSEDALFTGRFIAEECVGLQSNLERHAVPGNSSNGSREFEDRNGYATTRDRIAGRRRLGR